MTRLMMIGIGVFILCISLLADSIEKGAYPGFGWKQVIGAAIGLLILITGLIPKRLRLTSKRVLTSKIKEYDHVIFVFIIILIALLVRYSLFDFESGDYKCCLSLWFDFIQKHGGIKALKDGFSNYTPPYLYLLTFSTALPMPKLYAIKTISIVFDFAAATFAFLIVKHQYRNQLVPILSFLAVLFAPTIILNSALWAQCDAIYTTGMLASLYFLVKKKNGMAFLFYSIAFSFKMQALFLLPLYLALFLKGEIPIKHFFWIPAIYLIAILPSFLLGRSLNDLLFIYLNQAKTYQALTSNAPNLYQWLPNPYYQIFSAAGIAFSFMMVSLFCYIVYQSKIKIEAETIIKLSLVSVLMVPFFLPKMHERFFFPADVVSIVYAFYFPQYFYLPVIIGLVSFFSYSPSLFGRTPIDLQYLAMVIMIVILITTVDLVRSLYIHRSKV